MHGAGECGAVWEDDFDFLAAYIIPEDVWYIIPEEAIVGQGSIALYPHLKKSKYEKYKEAWHLLREHKVAEIHACVEEDGPQASDVGRQELNLRWKFLNETVEIYSG